MSPNQTNADSGTKYIAQTKAAQKVAQQVDPRFMSELAVLYLPQLGHLISCTGVEVDGLQSKYQSPEGWELQVCVPAFWLRGSASWSQADSALSLSPRISIFSEVRKQLSLMGILAICTVTSRVRVIP